MRSFHLPADRRHLAWDRTLAPAVVVGPGDELVLDLADASGGQIAADAGAEAIGRLDFAAVNPCTGPVLVEGVAPGDELVLSILEIDQGPFAWTANIPGFGLLADDFPDPHLWISTVRDGTLGLPIGVELPARPMIGTIGVAPAGGPAPLLVPTDAGGNMDIAQLVAGTTLHLPVQVSGALLSAGDSHALQGDGEVCGTGAETAATVRLGIDVRAGTVVGALVRALGSAHLDDVDLDDRDRARPLRGGAGRDEAGGRPRRRRHRTRSRRCLPAVQPGRRPARLGGRRRAELGDEPAPPEPPRAELTTSVASERWTSPAPSRPR